MELKDTIEMMQSADYKERFKAEYWQTKIRHGKLHDICQKHREGTLPFDLGCGIHILENQAKAMEIYLGCLEMRAELERIDLN